ncbi:hypothetical protein ACO0OL_004011 [Hanseniaspora opuntiae]|jgi:cell cycle serine/threonine-protein kinase CDC5/MSD2|uniref:Serine/threonine-protein kinase n=1 Tax=Hanseniaspora opuntiae TaxID=211096 RepID=A0A1E5RLE6_9ASCO|nr:Cell cycle serine/threonine-protein kinase CDC5/MSD2 [Hanseniaspora opuntiae]
MPFDPIHDNFLNSNNSPIRSPERIERQKLKMDKENLDTAAFKAQAVVKENQPQTPQKNTKKKKEKLSALCKTPPSIIRNSERIFHRGISLGEGGFARCFEVTDSNDIRYAAKTVAKASIVQDKTRKKLLSEIQIHRDIFHKNIVEFIECFEDDINVYIILEMCSKGSLMDLMKVKKCILEQDAKYITIQLAAGIKYLHFHGIVHRDLKLGNVFFDEHYDLKIGDFGLAATAEYNKKYTVCGTPNYIAPEVLTGAKTTGHSFEVDIWAIGIMIFAMVYGKPPFQCKNVSDIYKKVKSIDYSFPENRNISRDCQILIRDILSLHPQMRPSIDEIFDYPWFTYDFPKTVSFNLTGAKDINGNVLEHKFLTEETWKCENLYNLLSNSDLKSVPIKKAVLPNYCTEPIEYYENNAVLPRYFPIYQKYGRKDSHPVINTKLVSDITDLNRNRRIQEVSEQLDIPYNVLAGKNSQLPNPVSPIKVKQQPFEITLTQITTNKINYNLPLKILASECSLAVNGILNAKKNAMHYLEKNAPLSYKQLVSSIEKHPIIVTKWVDYSNKHGFAYQLSTDDIGVIFSNASTILSLSDVPEFWYITSDDSEGWTATHYEESNKPDGLKKHLEIIAFFSKYMNENLNRVSKLKREKYHEDDVFLRRYSRFNEFAMFELSDGSFQFNFKDHNKYVLSQNGKVLTFVTANKQEGTHKLEDILKHGGIPGQPTIDIGFVLDIIIQALQFKSRVQSTNSQ